jgi:hypothetical protein
MYIDSMTITAVVVFVIAAVMFVKTCFIMSCMVDKDNEVASNRDAESGGKE